MKTRLTVAQKIEALNNALKSLQFPEKYFIEPSDSRVGVNFAIVSKMEEGTGIRTHTNYMTYEDLNAFMVGYSYAKQGKLEDADDYNITKVCDISCVFDGKLKDFLDGREIYYDKDLQEDIYSITLYEELTREGRVGELVDKAKEWCEIADSRDCSYFRLTFI